MESSFADDLQMANMVEQEVESAIECSTIDNIYHAYKVYCITIPKSASNLGMSIEQWQCFFRLCIASLLHTTQHGPLKDRKIDMMNVISQYVAKYPTNFRQQPWNTRDLKSAWTCFIRYSRTNNAPWYLGMLRSLYQRVTINSHLRLFPGIRWSITWYDNRPQLIEEGMVISA